MKYVIARRESLHRENSWCLQVLAGGEPVWTKNWKETFFSRVLLMRDRESYFGRILKRGNGKDER